MAKQEKFGKMCKERMIEEIALRIKENPDFFVTSYMGSSSSDLELLRRNLKKLSARYFVVKNSTLKVVFNKLKLETMVPLIEGGVGMSLCGKDIISTCKTLVTFAKDHDKFKVKAAFIDGKCVSPERIKELAALPTREVLLARVVGGIKSPITGFVNVLGGTLRKFVYVVDAIKTKKQTTAESAQQSAAA